MDFESISKIYKIMDNENQKLIFGQEISEIMSRRIEDYIREKFAVGICGQIKKDPWNFCELISKDCPEFRLSLEDISLMTWKYEKYNNNLDIQFGKLKLSFDHREFTLNVLDEESDYWNKVSVISSLEYIFLPEKQLFDALKYFIFNRNFRSILIGIETYEIESQRREENHKFCSNLFDETYSEICKNTCQKMREKIIENREKICELVRLKYENFLTEDSFSNVEVKFIENPYLVHIILGNNSFLFDPICDEDWENFSEISEKLRKIFRELSEIHHTNSKLAIASKKLLDIYLSI